MLKNSPFHQKHESSFYLSQTSNILYDLKFKVKKNSKWLEFEYFFLNYYDESKVWQNFGDMRHNPADAFVKVLMMINYTGLWVVKLTRYSPSVMSQICFYGWEHSLEIHGFRSTWPCLIIMGFATCAKFLEPSGYYIVINCSIFPTTNVLGCFCFIMAQFELIKHKFPN